MGWTHRCLREFFSQGDEEKRRGLPVSPMCDRSTTNVPGSQIGFIQFIVQPTFEGLAALFPKAKEVCLFELESNKSAWEQRQQWQKSGNDDDNLLDYDDVEEHDSVIGVGAGHNGETSEAPKVRWREVEHKRMGSSVDEVHQKDLDNKQIIVDGEAEATNSGKVSKAPVAPSLWAPFCACSPRGSTVADH